MGVKVKVLGLDGFFLLVNDFNIDVIVVGVNGVEI